MSSRHTAKLLSIALSAWVATSLAAPAEAQRRFEDRESRQAARRDAEPFSRSNEISTRRGDVSRQIEGDIEADGDRAYRSRSVTGPDGETVGVLGEIERTESGYSATQTVTDRHGDTGSRSAARSLEDDRITTQREAVSRNGETAEATGTIERTETGLTRSAGFDTSTGRGGDLESEIERLDDGAAFSRSVTNADGETVATRDTTVSNTEDGASRTTTITDSEGEEYEYSRSVDND